MQHATLHRSTNVTTRAERHAQFQPLRDRGWALRQIAEHFGVSVSTVSGVLLDPSGEAARERKRRLYSKPCEDCGKTLNPGGKRGGVRCSECTARHQSDGTKQEVIASIREWASRFGGIPPVASDWNLALARNTGQHWRVARYHATRRQWPAVNTAQYHFGSWNAAVTEAGFDPFESGCYGRDGEYAVIVNDTVDRYLAGQSAYSIAKEDGVTAGCVAYRLQKAGIPMRNYVEAIEARREWEWAA